MNRKLTRLRVAAIAALSTAACYISLPVVAADAPTEELSEVVITGSILRRTSAETPSPVTVVTAESLEERGINTIADATQKLTANNAGAITQGWNTGFNFASGANAPALRGLTVQSTLSISDGVRMAPYPLADDGQRNFVDLNSIPDSIVDRVEVLRDGASSTYGADAIAGVINVITKKQITGLHFDGSYGTSSRSDANEKKIALTWGYGDINSDGFNFYVSGEYQKQDTLWARDRGYPFNSSDLSRVCGPSSCMTNLNWNGVTAEDGFFNGLITIPGVSLVRPVTTAGANVGAGRYALLNAAAGCRQWKTTTITAAMSGTSPLSTCEVDFQDAYFMLQPEIKRNGIAERFTFKIGDRAEAYVMGNLYKTDTFASFTPLGFNGTPTPPNTGAVAYNVIAPVYVCAAGVGTLNGLNTGCTAANGTLNPYNPFAAAGQTAQIILRSPNGRAVATSSRTLRSVIGVDGTFGNDWRYSANITASNVRLDRNEINYLIPQRIADVTARGTFNYANPMATAQSVWDYIAPTEATRSDSALSQGTFTIAKDLLPLQGGPLQAAVGAQYRTESIDAPSANPANDAHPQDRYYSVNSVGTAGSRNVKSAFFEINAPFVKQFEANLSGRYDSYSTGQNNFSPKLGVKYTVMPQLALRGTVSKGFRIPSFNEAFGLPTTGYVTRTLNNTVPGYAAFVAAHGNNAYATQSFSLGLTQVGNPSLNPEKSTSFTAGLIIEPTTAISMTLDFWRIKVNDLIVGVTDTTAPYNAYYSNNGVVNIPGIIVLPGTPDTAFPNALPQIGFIQSSFKNADSEIVQGIDIGGNLKLSLRNGMTFRSAVDASYLQKYDLTSGGITYAYAGTLSPCNITSCSGAPQWRASWQNTLEFGKASVSATTYYTSGYDLASLDYGGKKGDCVGNIGASVVTYENGDPVLCSAKPTWNMDLTGNYKINDKLRIYLNVLNALDIKAPFEPSAAYSLFQYNPAWAGPNILGRYMRLGVKAEL